MDHITLEQTIRNSLMEMYPAWQSILWMGACWIAGYLSAYLKD